MFLEDGARSIFKLRGCNAVRYVRWWGVALLSAAGIVSTSVGYACTGLGRTDLEYLANSQIIARAKIVTYSPVFDPEILGRQQQLAAKMRRLGDDEANVVERIVSDPPPSRARLRLQIVEVISGYPKLTSIEAVWRHSTFAVPRSWTGETDVVIGLRAQISADGGTFIEIVQQPCAPRFIFDDTAENVEAVQAALRAHSGRRLAR
jgi:hypothetical protein